jgi:hypothetical protein
VTTMMTKPPTPQGISALLRKEGFTKSESSATAVKGWRNRSRGYRVSRAYGEDGAVHVEHETGLFRIGDADRERAMRELERYAEVLTAHGYAVRKGGLIIDRLIVTAGER